MCLRQRGPRQLGLLGLRRCRVLRVLSGLKRWLPILNGQRSKRLKLLRAESIQELAFVCRRHLDVDAACPSVAGRSAGRGRRRLANEFKLLLAGDEATQAVLETYRARLRAWCQPVLRQLRRSVVLLS